MNDSNNSKDRNTTFILVAIGFVVFTIHCFTNSQYGFHRDELQTLDDARYLDWGFVAYPPVTPFIARLGLILFGSSITAARIFPAFAQAIVIVIAGLMARDLGGGRLAQIIAALATAASPVSMSAGALLQYVSFDFLWWVLLAYFVIKLVRTENPRWWLAIGVVIGLGMMTKYTMLFLVAGLAVGVFTSSLRRHLATRWLWVGVALSLLIFLPNAIWQIRHDFISLDFLKHIHARDIRWGRTKDFLPQQFYVAANAMTIPLWIAGLIYFFFRQDGRRYRVLGWMWGVPFALFVIAKGRAYYIAPGYPMLLAGGAVWEERWLSKLRVLWSRTAVAATLAVILFGFALMAPVVLPISHIGSRFFNMSGDFREEIGWPELAAEVARIRDTLPVAERSNAAVFAANYGEAGAIDMYGGRHNLPRAICLTNSFWLRTYPESQPETVIVLGLTRQQAESLFESVELAGHTSNSYSVQNEESRDHPDIFLCRHLRMGWPALWKKYPQFG